MDKLLLFLITYLLVYLFYFLFIGLRKKQLKKYRSSTEVLLLENAYSVNTAPIEDKKLLQILSLANGFIISTTITVVSFLKNILLQLLVGFVILIVLILVVYGILGKVLKKKYGVKERRKKRV